MFRIITSKQQKFSQSDPVLSANLKKNWSRIQSWSGQNWPQSWSSPDAHLWTETIWRLIYSVQPEQILRSIYIQMYSIYI